MFKRINPYYIIWLTVITSTLILWAPFILKWSGIGHLHFPTPLSLYDLYKHWDGVLYVVVAKTFYNINDPLLKATPLGLPAIYFAAHWPLYPLLIKLLSLIGYLRAMLVIPVIFTLLYSTIFYRLVKDHKLAAAPLLLTIVGLFITPRFFVVRSVPAPETLFMFLILTSIWLFLEKRFFWSGIAGALAVLTRSPGMLLFVGYGLYCLEQILRTKRINWQWLWLLLIPLPLLGIFTLYHFQMGDFWAYFHSGDNIHLLFPPFQVFDQYARWIGTGWLEDILFYYFFYALAIVQLYSYPKLRVAFWFMLVYFLAIIMVAHRDIARYSLPMLPFALIAHQRFLTEKRTMVAIAVLLPALYFFAWNFIFHNSAPVTNWDLFR